MATYTIVLRDLGSLVHYVVNVCAPETCRLAFSEHWYQPAISLWSVNLSDAFWAVTF